MASDALHKGNEMSVNDVIENEKIVSGNDYLSQSGEVPTVPPKDKAETGTTESDHWTWVADGALIIAAKAAKSGEKKALSEAMAIRSQAVASANVMAAAVFGSAVKKVPDREVYRSLAEIGKGVTVAERREALAAVKPKKAPKKKAHQAPTLPAAIQAKRAWVKEKIGSRVVSEQALKEAGMSDIQIKAMLREGSMMVNRKGKYSLAF